MLSKTFKNNDSIDCSICYNETNGIKMDYHTYLKYEEIWRRCKTADKQPLVKCIKCNNYTCINCKSGRKTLYLGCPFNCNELGQDRTICWGYHVYYKFGVKREYNYTPNRLTYLWFAQAIYEYQENPKPELMCPSTKYEIKNALKWTIDWFDMIYMDIDNQLISGLVKLPFEEQPIYIQYPVKLTLSSGQYQKNDPQVILTALINQFKEDIQTYYRQLDSKLYDSTVFEISRFNDIKEENYPDANKTHFEHGYTDYMKRVLKYWLIPYDTIQTYKPIGNHPGICLKCCISEKKGLFVYYEVSSLIYTDFLDQVEHIEDEEEQEIQQDILIAELKSTLRHAKPQEFKDFFKDCK